MLSTSHSVMKGRRIFSHPYPSTYQHASSPRAVPRKSIVGIESQEEEKKEAIVILETKQVVPPRVFPNHEANTFHDLCRKGVRTRNLHHVLFYVELLFLTVATVVAAVLYGHFYGGYPSMDDDPDPVQISLFLSTMLLPLVVAALQKKEAKLQTSQCYQKIAARSNAEIYKFRTHAAPYQTNSVSDTDHLKGRLAEFFGQIQKELQTDGLSAPEGDVFIAAELVAPNRDSSVASTEVMISQDDEQCTDKVAITKEKGEESDKTTKESKAEEKSLFKTWLSTWNIESGVETKEERQQARSGPTFVYIQDPDSYLEQFSELPFVNHKSFDEEDQKVMLIESTPIIAPRGADPTEPVSYATIVKPIVLPKPEAVKEEDKEVDDGSSMLCAMSYVKFRLQPWLVEHKAHVKTLQFWKSFLDYFIKVVNLAAVGAAALAKAWTVPMLLVLVAILDRILRISSIQHRIEVAEKAVADMEDVESWWLASIEGNGEDETTLTKLRDPLVEKTEAIIIAASSQ